MKSKRTPPADLDTLIPLLIGCWRRFHKLSGPPDKLQTREFRSVVESVQKLQELSNENYFENRDHLGAYLLYQWIIHYQEGLSLIGELPSTPKRVLDVCSGPASFAFAALRHGAREVYAVDQNMTALTLGAEVCGRYGLTLNTRKWLVGKEELPVAGSFDLIIVGHALNELFPSLTSGWQTKQQAFIQSLLKRLTPDGFLLIVDNSFTEANKRILSLRDQLVQEGIPVQAPCVFKGECPALKTTGSPCYAQRTLEKPYLIKEIQRAANINLSSLKMSYVIFKAPGSSWPSLPVEPLYRVISPPVESHFGKRFYLCGTDGKKNLGSRIQEHPKDTVAFEYLKRGELIHIENGLEKQNAIDLQEGSKLKVIAACGKPIPADDNEEYA